MWNPFRKRVVVSNSDLEFGKTWHRIAGGPHTGAYWYEVFIEGTLMQNYDGTGLKPRVVFSAGTEVFIRTEPWLREWYALTVPFQEPQPGTEDTTEDQEMEFFRGLANEKGKLK